MDSEQQAFESQELENQLLLAVKSARLRLDTGLCNKDEYLAHLERFSNLVLRGELPANWS